MTSETKCGHEGSDGEFSCHVGLFTAFFSGMVVFNLLIEYGRHVLEVWLKHRPHILAVIEHLYRELTTMGIVSFLLFILEQSGAVAGIVDLLPGMTHHELEYDMEVFEIVHMVLFCFVALYVFLVILLLVASSTISRRWRKREAGTFEHYMAQYRAFRLKRKSMSAFEAFTSLRFWWRYDDVKTSFAYHIMRRAWLQRHEGMPADTPFNKLLRLSVRDTALELAELKPSFWITILLFGGLNYLRYKIVFVHTTKIPLFIFFGACVLTGVLGLLAFKERRILNSFVVVTDDSAVTPLISSSDNIYSSLVVNEGAPSAATGDKDNAGKSEDGEQQTMAMPCDLDAIDEHSLVSSEWTADGMKRRFWFGRPWVHMAVLQLVMFAQAGIILYIAYFMTTDVQAIANIALILIPTAASSIILAPTILRRHSCNCVLAGFRTDLQSELLEEMSKGEDALDTGM